MHSSRIERLSKQLAAYGLSSSQRRTLVTRTAASSNGPYVGLIEMSQAVAIVQDEAIRAELGQLLWAQLNAPRIVHGRDLPPDTPLITAVIFSLGAPELLFSHATTTSLGFLTGPLDSAMSDLVDPLQPTIPPLILAVPLGLLDFNVGCALNYMLGNPARNELDSTYAELWHNAEHAPQTAVCALAYLFLTSRASVTFDEATQPDASPDLGPRTQSVLDVVTTHAHALNTQLPGLDMKLLEACSLAKAMIRGAEIRIRKTFADRRGELGAYITEEKQFDRDVAFSEALQKVQDEFIEKTRGQHQPPEELFGKAIVGVVSGLADSGGDQFGQCLLMSTYGVPSVATMLRVPQGVTTGMLTRWFCEEVDPEARAQRVMLPSLVASKIPQGVDAESYYRDEHGNWVELELLRLGRSGAARLLKTATWTAAVGKSQVRLESRQQMLDVPHPRLIKQLLDLEKVARKHFCGELADALLRRAARPGASYEWMQKSLADEFPDLVAAQMTLPHPTDAFMPPGFWAALHFEKAGGVVFRLRQTLQEAMEQTDLTSPYPLDLVRCPYPDIYIQLETPIELMDEKVLGIYCTDATLSDAECEDLGAPAGSRVFSMMLIATHQGDLSPEGYRVEYGIKPDDERDLAVMIRDGLKRVVAENAASASPLPDAKEQVDRLVSALTLAFKVILYVGMKSARLDVRLERQRLRERLKETRGSERERLLRKLGSAHDEVIVGPDVAEWAVPDRTAANYQKAVWSVRGFFTPVRFGPGRKQVRSEWRPPSFRHRHGLKDDGEAPTPKDYQIR